MEARMKLIRWTAATFAIIAMLLSGVGCEEKSGGNTTTDGTGTPGSIQIVLGTVNDTLYFLPGDSASTTVTIIVSDQQGRALAGQRVDVSLANANLGVIEWADANLLDTTNAAGRVNAVFRTYALAGNQIISAATGGVADNAVLTIQQSSNVICTLNMTVADTMLEANDFSEDSTQVILTIVDCAGHGIRDVSLDLRADGGRMIVPAPTDSGGKTSTWWYNNGQFGVFKLSIEVGGFRDSVSIRVQEIESITGFLQVTTSRRLIEADGCVTAASITAVLQNQFGEAVPNDTIRFGSPAGGSVTTTGVTDSLGRAFATFCGMGIPDDEDPTDSALVVASL